MHLRTRAAALNSEASTSVPRPAVPQLILPRGGELLQAQPQPSGREIEASALRLAVQWTEQHPQGLQV